MKLILETWDLWELFWAISGPAFCVAALMYQRYWQENFLEVRSLENRLVSMQAKIDAALNWDSDK